MCLDTFCRHENASFHPIFTLPGKVSIVQSCRSYQILTKGGVIVADVIFECCVPILRHGVEMDDHGDHPPSMLMTRCPP